MDYSASFHIKQEEDDDDDTGTSSSSENDCEFSSLDDSFSYTENLPSHLEDSVSKVKTNKVSSPKTVKKPSQGTPNSKDEKTYECSQCNQVFNKKTDLNRHSTTHSLDRPYECIECKRRFSKKEYLVKHLSMHSEAKVYVCSFCNYRSSRSDRYKVHMRSHGVTDPFKCSLCEKGFKGLMELNRHLNSHNSSVLDPEVNTSLYQAKNWSHFSCVDCGLTFDKPDKYKYHMRSHGIKEPYECSLCGEFFSNKLHLNRHLINHNAILQVTKAASNSNANTASPNEEGGKSESAGINNKSESYHSPSPRVETSSNGGVALKNGHSERHSDDRSKSPSNKAAGLQTKYLYSCKPCGMKFLERADHQEHMKVRHKKKFSCSKCGKSYTRKANLNKHPCGVSNDNPSCNTCGMSFTSSDELESHVRSHHIVDAPESSEVSDEAIIKNIDAFFIGSDPIKKTNKKSGSKVSGRPEKSASRIKEEMRDGDETMDFVPGEKGSDNQSPKKKKKASTDESSTGSVLQSANVIDWESPHSGKNLTIPTLENDSHDLRASEYEKLVVFEFMSMEEVLPESDHTAEDLIDDVVQVNDQISLKFFC